MMEFVLGILIGMGVVFTALAIVEKEEQKKIREFEKWERKLP